MTKTIDYPQGSAGWLASRVGRITASRVVDVLNIRKDGKPGADRLRYLSEVLCERLTGNATDHFVSDYMRHGTEMEPLARVAYEMATGVDVDQVGNAIHPAFDFFSASPDGCIGTDGMVEIKCPSSITHINWLLAGEVPAEHQAQMFSGMACWEREYCDFVSFDNRLPKPLQLFVKRLKWDDKRIEDIESAVVGFNDEVNAMIEKLRQLAGPFDLPAAMVPKVAELVGGLTDSDFEGLL